jgi:TonB family protein
MSIRQMLIGVVFLATSSVVFAQTTETKPPDGGSGRAPSRAIAANPCQSGAANQPEILTDTMGVDFGSYVTRITKIVRQNWYDLMPLSVYPPILKQGRLSIEFVIQKDGQVSGMKVHTSSGDVALDRAAWRSITTSTPFPPLPTEFPGHTLGLRFHFYYNFQPTYISISPCADVRVPAGSTRQFSASGKGITDTSVTWTVSGSGCSKSACGTISDTGLYTAPVNIPTPPTVVVEVTSQTDTGASGKTKLTVVQANPSP